MSRIGVSSTPHSAISMVPVSSPAPLSTEVAAGIGRANERGRVIGHDGGDARAGDRFVALAVPHGDVAHPHARDVGDRVVFARLERAEREAEPASAVAVAEGRAGRRWSCEAI